jgi:hypothetical protein
MHANQGAKNKQGCYAKTHDYLFSIKVFAALFHDVLQFLTTEKIQIKNKVRVLAVPHSMTDYKAGDVAIVYPHSDYLMTHNLNGKIEELIRVKYTDCLAIDHDFDKRGY